MISARASLNRSQPARTWTGARAELERVLRAGVPLEKELAVVAKLLEEHAA